MVAAIGEASKYLAKVKTSDERGKVDEITKFEPKDIQLQSLIMSQQ
jgi:hypothetical protein